MTKPKIKNALDAAIAADTLALNVALDDEGVVIYSSGAPTESDVEAGIRMQVAAWAEGKTDEEIQAHVSDILATAAEYEMAGLDDSRQWAVFEAHALKDFAGL